MTDIQAVSQPIWLGDRPIKVEFLVKDYMVKKALDNSRRFNIFHPSAWGQCLRKVAYQWYNDKDQFVSKGPYDIDERTERIFDNGHSMHRRWQEYLDESGVLNGVWKCPYWLCGRKYGIGEKYGIKNPSRKPDWKCECGCPEILEYEEPLVQSAPEYNFIGHCDGIIDVSGTRFEQKNRFDRFVVDFKSMKEELFMELTGPKDEHVVQVNIYMWILDLQGAVLCYENKNTQALKEMFVPRDEDLIEKIKAQAIWMRGMLAEGKLPFRPNGFTRSKFPCRFCDFVDHCYQ